MTTGEPLVVRCRDEAAADADQAAAVGRHRDARAGAGAARADRLVRRAGGGRRGGGDARDRAGRAPTGRSSAATTSTTCGRRWPPTKSGSGGSGGGRRRARARLHRLHGGGEDDRGARRGGRARRPRGRLRPRAGGARRAGAIEDFFAVEGEAAFRALEEEVVCELLAAPPGPVISLGGGAVKSERVREALARHVVVLLDVDADDRLAAGRRPAAARARPRGASRRCTPSAGRSTTGWPTWCSPTPRATWSGARSPAMAALREAPGGTRMLWARSASGDYPVYVGHGAFAVAPRPRGGRAFLVTDETVGALYGDQVGEVAATQAIPPGEAAKTWEQAGRVLRGLAAAGMAHDDHVRRARRRRGRRPRGVLRRRPTSAACPSCSCRRRSSPRSTRPTAARPASTCRRARTTPAPTTSPPRCWPTRPCSRRCRPAELAAGWAEVIKTALIAGGPLWERVRRPDALVDADLVLACARTKLAVVAAGRARRRAAARCSTSATRSATRSRPRRATRAIATARRSASGCSRRSRSPASRRCAPRPRRCWRRTGCRSRSTRAVDHEAVLARAAGRQEAPRRTRRLRAGRGARRRADRPRGAARRRRARSGRVGALMRNRVAVMHGVNLDALDRRPAEHYGGLTFARLE